jgi:hypothetical protein
MLERMGLGGGGSSDGLGSGSREREMYLEKQIQYLGSGGKVDEACIIRCVFTGV